MQNDLRMAKEKARRKQAIIGRQEEELAAREGNLDSMRKEQASSSRQVDHLQEDNKALKVAACQQLSHDSPGCPDYFVLCLALWSGAGFLKCLQPFSEMSSCVQLKCSLALLHIVTCLHTALFGKCSSCLCLVDVEAPMLVHAL